MCSRFSLSLNNYGNQVHNSSLFHFKQSKSVEDTDTTTGIIISAKLKNEEADFRKLTILRHHELLTSERGSNFLQKGGFLYAFSVVFQVQYLIQMKRYGNDIIKN